MNTVALIIALYESFSFLNTVEEKIGAFNPAQAYWKSVSLTHSTITLTLHTKSDSVKRSMSDVYLKASFNIQEGNIAVENLYCEDAAIADQLRTYIAAYAPKRFDTTVVKKHSAFTEEVLRYLRSADEIAKQVQNCSSGDNYYPGYFSEIIIEETQIILKQVNRWNARSIDHKNDYHMRDLEFYVPLALNEIEHAFIDELIGRMGIHFSDHSTPNNKSCGDKIAAQIKLEKTLFESNTK